MAFHTKEQHRWLQLKGLFKEIRNVASIDELQVKLRRIFEQAGHVVENLEDYECYGEENNFWPFSGLGIYLTKFATQEERKDFFDQILPQIAILAEDLVSYLNDRKISLEWKGRFEVKPDAQFILNWHVYVLLVQSLVHLSRTAALQY